MAYKITLLSKKNLSLKLLLNTLMHDLTFKRHFSLELRLNKYKIINIPQHHTHKT